MCELVSVIPPVTSAPSEGRAPRQGHRKGCAVCGESAESPAVRSSADLGRSVLPGGYTLATMGDFDALCTSLDPDERRRGFQFEHLCKWFLENDPAYTTELTSVWLWKQWPGRWRDSEAGIDLVAEDVDGKLWAIQAKAYGEDKPIPKRELDKFLSESNRSEFAYRLLISTSSRGFHHIARETIQAQDKPVYLVDISDLRASPAPWPGSFEDLRPAGRWDPAIPREHQLAPIRDVLAGFRRADRGQLLMACGTGKTLTAWFITTELAAERTLVLVPSLSLLKQTMREWQRATGGEQLFAALPVCSDDTVRSGDDPALAYTAEVGVRVTTEPGDIAAFMRKSGSRVVFCTYQSSPQVAQAFEQGNVPPFDLVIADFSSRLRAVRHVRQHWEMRLCRTQRRYCSRHPMRVTEYRPGEGGGCTRKRWSTSSRPRTTRTIRRASRYSTPAPPGSMPAATAG